MSLLKFILSYFFFFLLLLKMITSQETCSSTQCSANEPKIDFPFGVKDRQGEKCASKGFTIECNSLGKTVLKMPNAGDFLVETITYGTKEIKLSDPLNCLPYRYLQSSASLTNLSPFMGFSYHTYSFYECPQIIINDPVVYTVLSPYSFIVSCYSLSNGALLITTPASSTDSFQMITNQRFIDYGCRLKESVSIPIPARAVVDIYSYNVVKDYLYLTWTEPHSHDDPKGGPPPPPPSNEKGDPGNQENNGMKAVIMALIVVISFITLIVCLVWGPKAGVVMGLRCCGVFAQGIPCCLGIPGFLPCTCCC